MNSKQMNKKMCEIIPRQIVYCDVGARGGLGEPWKTFEDSIKLISFEPDQEEYKKLIGGKRDEDIVYPYALYKEESEVSLYLTKSRGSSSIYKPNIDVLQRYPEAERFNIEKVVSVNATSLDILYKRSEIKDVDFVKVDVQGAELDVLVGGKEFLGQTALGMDVEVEFLPMYKQQPLFSDVDLFIRESLGLQIQDIQKHYWKYKGEYDGSSKGQLIFGNALYFRSPQEVIALCKEFDSRQAVEKFLMACLMGIVYGYLDYSLYLLSLSQAKTMLGQSAINIWNSAICEYRTSLKYNFRGVGKIANVFHLLYRVFQPNYNGWGSMGHHLGTRKKMGIFE